MSIPVFRTYIKRKDMDAVLSCLVTDSIGSGEYLDRFQKGAREVFGFDNGFAVRSPYVALDLALGALGLVAGDAIVLSALSPSYQLSVLKQRCLTCLFADVALDTGLPTRETVQAAIEGTRDKPKALLLGGGVGLLADADLFSDFGLPIVEDFTKCLGATRGGLLAASIGNLSFVGLESDSVMTAGGGALLYAHARREASVLRNLAESIPNELRMTDFNAALGFAQLRQLERTTAKRREIRQLFNQSLASSRHKGFVQTGEAEAGCWSYPVVIESSTKDAIAYARKKDIETELAFADSCVALGHAPHCTNARSLSMRSLLFPLHQRIGSSGAQKISRVLATLP